MKKILIINKINSSNLGDQAIGQSMKALAQRCNCLADCVDLTNASAQNIKAGEFSYATKCGRQHMKNAKMLKYYLKRKNTVINDTVKQNLNSYSAVFIGGGELIQDNNIFPVAIYIWINYIRKNNPNIPIYLFGVGVTSKFNRTTKYILKRSLSYVSGIYVRDINSYKNLKNIYGIGSCVIPDVVFSSNHVQCQSKSNLALLGITTPHRLKYYGYCSSVNDYFEKVRKTIEELKAEYDNVELIYSDNGDYTTALEFRNWLDKNYSMSIDIAEYRDLDGMIALIEKAKLVQSPRMHACILGLLSSSQVEVVEVSPKIKTFKEIYLEKCVTLEELNFGVEDAFLKIIDCLT